MAGVNVPAGGIGLRGASTHTTAISKSCGRGNNGSMSRAAAESISVP